MAAEKTRFLFDRDFDDVALLNEISKDEEEKRKAEAKTAEEENDSETIEEEVVPVFSEEDVTAARQQGFDEGKEEGLRESLESTEKRIAETLDKVGQKLTEIFQVQEDANEAMSRDTVSLSLAVGRKLFPSLNEKHGFDEITNMTESVLRRIIQEPRITIYGNDTISEAMSERIDVFLTSRGFQGDVKVVGDGSMALGDCRIEWSNGEAVRDISALLDEIADTFEKHIGSAAIAEETDTETDTETEPVTELESGGIAPEASELESESEPEIGLGIDSDLESEPENVNMELQEEVGPETVDEPEKSEPT